MLLQEARFALPTAESVMARAAGENFPVASRVLPRETRAHLLAVYGFARLVDELGDCAPGDRLAALDWLSQELERAYEGTATHPLLVRLTPTLRERDLPRGPFLRLIEANRLDQSRHRYQTWEQLCGYCELSANPVGELVLSVFGQSTPERVRLSDLICTALQLTEHCQDIAEDLLQDRVYLPLEDLARFGCELAALHEPVASEPLREVLAFEVARARRLLEEGVPLTGELGGRARIAVAAFVAGARAALDAIERAGYDVMGGPPQPKPGARLWALSSTLLRSRAGR
jgi:squalene synthase HpnC